MQCPHKRMGMHPFYKGPFRNSPFLVSYEHFGAHPRPGTVALWELELQASKQRVYEQVANVATFGFFGTKMYFLLQSYAAELVVPAGQPSTDEVGHVYFTKSSLTSQLFSPIHPGAS